VNLYTFRTPSTLNFNTDKDYNFSSENSHSGLLKFSSGSNLSFRKEDAVLFSEKSSSQRFNRFSNLMINYDYKTGNYLGS
jgi:hypothetical protein